MNRKIIIILTIILVALIAIFGIRAAQKSSDTAATSTPAEVQNAPQTPIKPTTDEETYTDPGHRFTFNYPKGFAVSGPTNTTTYGWRVDATTPGYLLATLIVPKSYMPGTNFSDAKLTVGESTNPAELGSTGCPASTGAQPGAASAVTINGQAFTKITSDGAAAGNLYETTGYYTIRDGDCYAVEYTIHSTNIGNYDPSQGVKEFDKAKIKALMEGIVKSFVFTIKSE